MYINELYGEFNGTACACVNNGYQVLLFDFFECPGTRLAHTHIMHTNSHTLTNTHSHTHTHIHTTHHIHTHIHTFTPHTHSHTHTHTHTHTPHTHTHFPSSMGILQLTFCCWPLMWEVWVNLNFTVVDTVIFFEQNWNPWRTCRWGRV